MTATNWLFDERIQSWSIQTTMAIGEYIDLVNDAHQNPGSLVVQRTVLTTTTAKRIRQRMVQPARIGFIVAIGVAVLGRPGANREPVQRQEWLAELKSSSVGTSGTY